MTVYIFAIHSKIWSWSPSEFGPEFLEGRKPKLDPACAVVFVGLMVRITTSFFRRPVESPFWNLRGLSTLESLIFLKFTE